MCIVGNGIAIRYLTWVKRRRFWPFKETPMGYDHESN